MPRALIAALVATVIALLTAAVYFVTVTTLEGRIRKDVENQVSRAQSLFTHQAYLESLSLLKGADELARDTVFVRALEEPNPALASKRFREFRADLKLSEARPDILALVDREGQLLVLFAGETEVDQPTKDAYISDGKVKYPAIALALASTAKQRGAISEVWEYEGSGPMRVAVAPIVDTDFGEIEGALIIAYSITDEIAARERDQLGADVAYFYGDHLVATSFGGGADALSGPLLGSGLVAESLESETRTSGLHTFEVGDETYVAAGLTMRRSSRQRLPKDYPEAKAGAVVFRSMTAAAKPVGTVKLAILLLGIGALVVSLLAMVLSTKTLLGPIDEIEVGINEIINGNLERTFRPVGSDLDGLANALNVMLARLLGRPEPGEEEYDDDGNVIRGGGALQFEPEGLSPKDAEAVRLAQEPEESYYRRVFDEYIKARSSLGESVEGITQEGFVAKLRLNEANLRDKYQCRSVRFKVVVKDGKVSLKPVPIA